MDTLVTIVTTRLQTQTLSGIIVDALGPNNSPTSCLILSGINNKRTSLCSAPAGESDGLFDERTREQPPPGNVTSSNLDVCWELVDQCSNVVHCQMYDHWVRRYMIKKRVGSKDDITYICSALAGPAKMAT